MVETRICSAVRVIAVNFKSLEAFAFLSPPLAAFCDRTVLGKREIGQMLFFFDR